MSRMDPCNIDRGIFAVALSTKTNKFSLKIEKPNDFKETCQ